MAFVIRSVRALEQVVLAQQTVNIDGDQSISAVLPAGFGDCLVLAVGGFVSSIATMQTNPELRGVAVTVEDAVSTVLQPLGAERWVQNSPTGLMLTLIDPDQAVLMLGDEHLQFYFAEVDTNVSPTADVTFFALVRRLRQLGGFRSHQRRGFELTHDEEL